MSTIRAFFAIAFPLSVQNEIHHAIQVLEENFQQHVRFTPAQNLHVTLQFLKEVKLSDQEKILAAVRDQLDSIKPFYLEWGALELFPTSTHPKLISIKVGPHETLNSLAHCIGQGILETNYPIETRPFRGHLTLGRFIDKKKISLDNIQLPPIKPFFVTEITLFQSKTTPVYQPLGQLSLG